MTTKGKQATKGQRQIVEENKETLHLYSRIVLSTNAVYLVLTCLFFWNSFTIFYMFISVLALGIMYGSYRGMQVISRPTYTQEGAIADSGVDLNMKEGMAEHLKDLILFTGGLQLASLISNYFWLLIFVIPGRAFYLLWVNILAPWFFAEAPEVDEKKAKKMERKMKRGTK
ncbi:hypothetical protein HELRODRAFT_155421 [Helobdella robusta]|uniref:Transmembrane protein 208 n=1 Tax=Helobdella robusta TaxID=6412 RepID=T1ELI3_HELRO|nr:hypothetical protein HELRODRAFT_155421 [Helobdella robusta]ESN90968.1 hypothetical protein HELRODRAFT_155421 [Helobdella robusta]